MAKRFAAAILAAMVLIMSEIPFVFAENSGSFVIHDSTYVPRDENYATREEAVAGFIKAAGLNTDNVSLTVLKKFTDYEKIAAAYAREIAGAVSENVVSGYEDGTFRPQGAITRCEALVILNRILSDRTLPYTGEIEFKDIPAWAEKDIARLAGAGVVKGYGSGILGAEDFLTSEQVTILAERAERMIGPMGDYYEYINEKWLKNTEIPQGMAAWSDFNEVSQSTKKEIGDIVYSLNRRKYKEGESFADGSSEQKIVDVFTAGGNTVYRDKLGLEPVKKYLDMISGVKKTDDLLKVMADLERAGFQGLLPFAVSADLYNSSEYVLAYSESYHGIIGDANAYEKYLTELFALFGENGRRAETKAKAVTEMCRDIAGRSMTAEEKNRIDESYKTYTKENWKTVFTNIDLDKYLRHLGFSAENEIVIYNLRLAEVINELFVPDNVELIKDYLRACVMDCSAMYLNTEAFLIRRDYMDALNGTESGALPGDYAVANVEELLGWDLAKLYTEKYASNADKMAVEEMTQVILAAYKSRLRKNKWLSASSLGAATKKLDSIKVKVGYPDNIDDYINHDYRIRSTADGGNLIEYRADFCEQYFIASAAVLNGKTEQNSREVWRIFPQTVNAMYEPSTNSITIPAAMLRPPFYDSKASYETNLGGIGMVIAHEISHALDSFGSKFDDAGNMKDWWLAEDKEAFDGICVLVTEEYNKLELMQGLKVDGELTLNENLADIAGMACILDAAGKDNPRLKDLFASYAACWRTKSTDAYKEAMLKTDMHAPDKIRVNRVLSNFDEFQHCYGIREGDGMYLTEEQKIKIW